VPPVQSSPDLYVSTLPAFQYTRQNGYVVSFLLRVQVKPVPSYLSSAVLSDEQPNQNAHPEVFIHFVNADYMQLFSNAVQCPHASPLDHTAMSGIFSASAYFFTLLKPACHCPGLTVADSAARYLRNVLVVLAMFGIFLQLL